MKLKAFLFSTILFFFTSLLLAQTTYVFVGTFNRDRNKEGIAVYKLDSMSGKLTKVHSVLGILNPSYLAVGSDSQYVYACTESQTENSGYINSFKFNSASGHLTEINRQKTSGDNPVYLTIDRAHRYLLSVNYTESSVDVFPLANDGSLKSVVQTISFTKGSMATERQNQSHVHSIIFTPDHRYLLMPDLGADEIKTFQFDSLQPKPVNISSYKNNQAVFGSGPRHICFHPNERNVYCIEEIGGAVSNYEFRNGTLQFVERKMLHNGKDGDYNSADIHVSPDGKFLYASNRGEENNIAIFSIAANGKLKFVTYQSSLGKHPRMFGISPDGNYLIVANQLSNNLRVFRRNKTNGKLKATKQIIKIENPSCVQIKTYN